MKNVLITWGFSHHDGTPYLDCYLDLDDLQSTPHEARMMDMRCSSQGTKLALLRLPKDYKREYLENYINHASKEDIKTLNTAKININNITRKAHESQAIDFIKHS